MPGLDDRDGQDIDDMPDFGDHVEDAIFSQILEMDDSPDDREFSAPLVLNFFEQASETFDKMQTALDDSNLDDLSSLGHFLKGSSATLGFNKIRDSCQVIQQYGHKLTVDGAPEPDEKVCLKKIGEALKTVKVDTAELEKEMKKFFNQPE
ncbi:signal transduction histidine kinase [Parachaetomium inaequale]|uniref:Signal transduction histidine kinase n=1 Tax=Parachaetomium inaequale TaxID=2588326 RepID=A0AAN6SNJ1_9PEZI|nr:signal transduction histidine kinase [Parachaetomium inaequale]